VPALDFAEFAEPFLLLPLHGVTYACRPPSVPRAAVIAALNARSRVQLGLDPGPVAPDALDLLEREASDIPLAVLTLGQDIYDGLLVGRRGLRAHPGPPHVDHRPGGRVVTRCAPC
jgi:hypothetical protein